MWDLVQEQHPLPFPRHSIFDNVGDGASNELLSPLEAPTEMATLDRLLESTEGITMCPPSTEARKPKAPAMVTHRCSERMEAEMYT